MHRSVRSRLHTAFDRRRFEFLLAAAVVATYLLVVLGATGTARGAGTVCSTWPACETTSWGDDRTIIALTHRFAALVAGTTLAAATAAGFIVDAARRIRLLLAFAMVAFVVQVGVGAALAVGWESLVAEVHLGLGIAIFVGTLAALTWTLEPEGGPSGVSTAEPDADAPIAASAASDTAPSVDEHPSTITSESVPRFDRVRAYVELTKPRLMWLVCLLAVAGMALAATTGARIDPVVAVVTVLGGALAIGASGTFNHLFERDRDSRMDRTADRPVATGGVSTIGAVIFGIALCLLSLGLFLAFVNRLAAVLTVFAVGYYSVVYTVVLKPNTRWNTVIGGLAGAMPAPIGWAAVTGDIGLPAVVLAGIVFLWTPAHFYNLALAYEDDYRRGGYPMLPIVAGRTTTRRRILGYLGATLLATAVLGALVPALGVGYAVAATVVGAIFLAAVIELSRTRTRDAAMRAFHASNAYLGVVLLAVVVDGLVLGAVVP